MSEFTTSFLSVLTPGNLVSSIVAGLIAGAYLTTFHPTLPGRRELVRRSVLQGWYFGFLGSLLYVARVAFAIANHQTDLGRVAGGWALWLLFSATLALGAFLWSSLREPRGS